VVLWLFGGYFGGCFVVGSWMCDDCLVDVGLLFGSCLLALCWLLGECLVVVW